MRKTLIALFAVYLALLVWVILWKAHLPFIGRDDMREIKLVPFGSSAIYGASDPIEVLANLAMFVPLGVYLAALGLRWKVGIIVGASLALELAQFALATGSSDVTDVIVNTAGGLLGVGAFVLVRPKPRTVVWGMSLVTLLAAVAIAVAIASFPRMPAGGGIVIQSVVTF